MCVSAILTYSASGYVISHTLYYDSLVVIGQFLSITVCMQMCYVNSTPALRFVCRDSPVCITQLCMQICYVNSTRALQFVLSMIGRFLSDHAVSSCITRSRNREQFHFQMDYFKVYSRLKLAAGVDV